MKIRWRDWQKCWNRPLTLNQAEFYSRSCSTGLAPILGRGLYNQVFVFRGDNVDGYFLKRELQNFDRYILKNYFSDASSLRTGNQKVMKHARRLEDFFLSFKKIRFSALRNSELSRLYKRAFRVLCTDFGPMWVGWIVEHMATVKVTRIIAAYGLPASQLQVVAGLERPHHIMQEQLDLMRLAADRPVDRAALRRHCTKYAYIPCYSVDIIPHDLAYFQARIQGVTPSAARRFIAETQDGFRKNHEAFRNLLRETEFSRLDRLFLEYFHEFSFLKDYRSHFRSLAMFYLRQIFQEIARRYGLAPAQVSLLFSREIVSLLKGPKLALAIERLIKRREKLDFTYLFRSGRWSILENRNAQATGRNRPAEINGVSANKGRVTGTVRIVLNPNSISKVKKGDILVSSMTRPDYISAMRKAAAIITDEGGLLCHAAIVAREMNKPCIINTKNATRLLKDGDWVVVDANSGKVIRK